MRTYRVRISRKTWRDVEELSDYLLTVISIEGARPIFSLATPPAPVRGEISE